MVNMLITLAVEATSAVETTTDSSAISKQYTTIASATKVVAIVAFALAVACLVFAIFTFIGFKIPNVINDLSGRTAKKSIAKMRSDNEKSGDKSFGPSVKAKDRGTTTDKIRESEKLINKKTPTVKTDSDATDVLNSDATLPLTNNTTILSEETEVLSDNATTVLEESTTVLDEDTTVLCVESVPVSQQPNLKFEIIQNIVLIHTNEVI